MYNANALVEVIKRAAVDAVNASQPSDFCYGTVTSNSPLKILVEQKMELTAKQLVLTRTVTDFEVNATIDWETQETSGGREEEAFAAHAHGISGTKKIKLYCGLNVGDKVVLIRKKGGQQYLVLDKVVKAT